MTYLKKLFAGNEKAWFVFWVIGGVGGIILQFWFSFMAAFMGSTAIILDVIMIVWNLFFAVILWKNAFNVKHNFWGYIIRFFSILGIIGSLAIGWMIAQGMSPFAMIGGLSAAVGEAGEQFTQEYGDSKEEIFNNLGKEAMKLAPVDGGSITPAPLPNTQSPEQKCRDFILNGWAAQGFVMPEDATQKANVESQLQTHVQQCVNKN